MSLSTKAALAQRTAAQLSQPAPVASEDWTSVRLVETSRRVSALCRSGGRIIAEFAEARGIVSVVDIRGIGHKLTNSERARIDAAVKMLGYLDQVQISCNGADAIIAILGGFDVNDDTKRYSVSIVWKPIGISGLGGRTSPAMEVVGNLP